MSPSENTHPRECEVFLAAAEIADDAARFQFLEQACGEDEHLRSRVATLLEYDQEADDLEPPEPWIAQAIHDYRSGAVTQLDSGIKSAPGGLFPG